MEAQPVENYHCPGSHIGSIPLSRAMSEEEGVSCKLLIHAIEAYLPGWVAKSPDTKSKVAKWGTGQNICLFEGEERIGSFSLHFKSQGKMGSSYRCLPASPSGLQSQIELTRLIHSKSLL